MNGAWTVNESGGPDGERQAVAENSLRCLDCGLLYRDFPLDVNLPRGQWLEIHPGEDGVLCAQCIVQRASKIPGATVAHMVIEIAPRHDGRLVRRG